MGQVFSRRMRFCSGSFSLHDVGRSLIFCIVDCLSSIRNDSIIMVAIFSSSEGWNLKGPIGSQRAAPFVVLPTK